MSIVEIEPRGLRGMRRQAVRAAEHEAPRTSPAGHAPARAHARGAYGDLLALHYTLGNRAVGRLLQPKLVVGAPDDKYEREADRVAEQVMRRPEGPIGGVLRGARSIQRMCGGCASSGHLYTECADEAKEHDKGDNVAPRIVHEVLRSPGQPLDPATRAFMEPRFNHDFSHVRVHAGSRAAETARTVNARAFTVGRDIVLGAGQYAAGTNEGRKLLAHELAHVVQQSHSPSLGMQRKRGRSSDEAKVYWQMRRADPKFSEELRTINEEVDRRFWMKHAAQIPWGTRLDPSKPSHRPLISSWLSIRDAVVREQMHGPLGVTDLTRHWEFYISGDRIMAISTPGATCADLADGTLCEGPHEETLTVDVTGAFPSWVREALTAQAASGIRFTQPSPESEVGGYHAFHFDLGYGNCHGFSLQIFQLFADVPITKWYEKFDRLDRPPEGVPTLVGMFPPRERAINVLDDNDQDPVASAHYFKTSEPGGYRWIALIEVGDRAIMKRIAFVGGREIDIPVFGDWGNAKKRDHSVIALGQVGNDRVYVLQKMSPMNPYFINVEEIANFDWYDIPPSECRNREE